MNNPHQIQDKRISESDKQGTTSSSKGTYNNHSLKKIQTSKSKLKKLKNNNPPKTLPQEDHNLAKTTK
ncbi:hypothetical protein C922_05223 [Plasmodium inui San Antonio 1]|uniref:Uncharacterized protein n=1 Tax=Plasmodium inui San Antonio 1 TaxID=1237626 RepID=W6ZTY0_9APIC|nr:hypothetical protein C922_05223 [Plasmodium inui San Antonio 1]EUD64402.1 hypothetical protein C922_05223 [Plasmodium inui San Antonio 1]